jgi:RNA polymerase sigma factor for flagellar operon FliA
MTDDAHNSNKSDNSDNPAPRRKLSREESERLINEHAPLVAAIARSLLRKLPSNVLADDLMQDGFLGLMAAIIQSTTHQAGKCFHSYLSQRIRGAMLDGLRENDPGSRRVRREMRRVECAIHQLGHQLGRAPLESEVAAKLALPLAAYQHLLQEAEGYTLFSLDDFDDRDPEKDFIAWCATTQSSPLAALERRSVQRTLLLAISDLGEREEEVMKRYYVDGLGMKAIGVRLGITESRVSQIHAQAIAKLRAAVLGDETAPSPLAPRWRTA